MLVSGPDGTMHLPAYLDIRAFFKLDLTTQGIVIGIGDTQGLLVPITPQVECSQDQWYHSACQPSCIL